MNLRRNLTKDVTVKDEPRWLKSIHHFNDDNIDTLDEHKIYAIGKDKKLFIMNFVSSDSALFGFWMRICNHNTFSEYDNLIRREAVIYEYDPTLTEKESRMAVGKGIFKLIKHPDSGLVIITKRPHIATLLYISEVYNIDFNLK